MPDKDKWKLETTLAELIGVLSVRTDGHHGSNVPGDTVCSYLSAERSRGTSLADFSQILIRMLRKTEDGGPLE